MAPPGEIADPFTGTEAAGWASGADGVVAPGDDPAYLAVRRALVLARIDRDEAAFLGFIAPVSRATFGRKQLLPSVVTLVQTGSELLGIRVRGSMFEATDQHDRLVVMTDYRFAYAFEPDNPDGPASVVFVAAQVDFQLREDGLRVLAATSSTD